MERSGEAIGLLRSRCFRESSERSLSVDSILTAGTCACSLELLAVLSLVVASPVELKTLLVAVLHS